MNYKALVVRESIDETGKGVFVRKIEQCETDNLPAGEILIRVAYSSLNYKDALSATGNKGVTRNYPHTPGIDVCGEIVETASSAFTVGDEVIVTGYDLGMNTSGGFAEFVRVPAAWCVRKPLALSPKDAMIFGTAGLTAALCVDKLLQRGLSPEIGSIVVTGATGGVGSIAIALLAKLGFNVVAVSGKSDSMDYCKSLGATEILSRDVLAATPKPMLKEQWIGAVDTVGGEALNSIIKQIKHSGVVTACGMTAGISFNASVFPFILRGVELLGVDSVEIPLSKKVEMWNKLATAWRLDWPAGVVKEVSLEQLDGAIQQVLSGKHVGRTVVNCRV